MTDTELNALAEELTPRTPHIAKVCILHALGTSKKEVIERIGITNAQYWYSLAHLPCDEEQLRLRIAAIGRGAAC